MFVVWSMMVYEGRDALYVLAKLYIVTTMENSLREDTQTPTCMLGRLMGYPMSYPRRSLSLARGSNKD